MLFDGGGGWQEGNEFFPAYLLSRSVSPLCWASMLCAGHPWSLPPVPSEGPQYQSIFPPAPGLP